MDSLTVSSELLEQYDKQLLNNLNEICIVEKGIL